MRLARRTDSGGVELRVTAHRRMRRWALGMVCRAEEWNDKAQRFTARLPDHAARNSMLGEVLRIAGRIVDQLMLDGTWSWEEFHRRYSGGGASPLLHEHMERMARDAEARGSTGVARNYRHSYRAVERFGGVQRVALDQVTPDLLTRMDHAMRAAGMHDGGISAIMRDIRAAMNRAMKLGMLAPERYPFATARTSGYEMSRLKRRAMPRALTPDELQRLKDLDLAQHADVAFAVRIFLLSYYARGINFTDLADLRTSELAGGRIRYRRRKTASKSERVLSIPVRGPLEDLLRQLGTGTGGYLLPILGSAHRTPRQKADRKAKVLAQVNADLKRAAQLAGIDAKLTTYVARHTYATMLKGKDVSVARISEALGHASVGTTQLYLAQFAQEELDATDHLL